MKRYIFILFVLLSSMETFAQKSYVDVVCTGFRDGEYTSIYLSGNLPSNMDSQYRNSTLGNIMNKLSENGYDLEFCFGDNHLIFSTKSSNPSSGTRNIVSDDIDVHEIARYNLQGMPIRATEKGVQIVVYSNYTTKTVIVQ